MISRDEAYWLHKCLLGRDLPQGELEAAMNHFPSFEEARVSLIMSPTFRDSWFPSPVYRAEVASSVLHKHPSQKLAIASIVKNEFDRIEDMIASCLPIADYFVILDTGSTDGTPSKADQILARSSVSYRIDHAGFENFSQARNLALSLVPEECNWILMLDADERIVPEDHQRLLDLLKDSFDGWKLPRYNFLDKDKVRPPAPYPDYQFRLFRNTKENPIRYSGAVHESPMGVATWSAAPASNAQHGGPAGGPHIHHMGNVLTSPERFQEKHELYTKLAEAAALASAAPALDEGAVAKKSRDEEMKQYAQISFSQCGEDLFLKHNFFGEKSDGFYVDIGAHHPFRFSNTCLLHERGWRGINVDVDPRAIAAFDEFRPNDINILCGVAEEAGSMTLHLFEEGAVNTLSSSLAAEYSAMPGRQIIEKKVIKVEPIAAILDKYLPPGQAIDMMNIDVEGLDSEALRSNDWNKYRPYALLVEIHNANILTIHDNEITKYLARHGYEVAGIITLTTIFRRIR